MYEYMRAFFPKKFMYRRGGQVGNFRLVAELAIYVLNIAEHTPLLFPRKSSGSREYWESGSVGDCTVSCCMDGRWLYVACTRKALAVELDQGCTKLDLFKPLFSLKVKANGHIPCFYRHLAVLPRSMKLSGDFLDDEAARAQPHNSQPQIPCGPISYSDP